MPYFLADLSMRQDDIWIYWPGFCLANKFFPVILSPAKDLPKIFQNPGTK